MQRREAGVGPAALELHEQGFFGWAGEVTRTLEGAVSATRALFLLEEKKSQDHILQLMSGSAGAYSKKHDSYSYWL